MMKSLFRKVVAVAGLMPLCMVASAGNMGTGEVHAVFNGLEWQKGKGKLLVQFVKPDVGELDSSQRVSLPVMERMCVCRARIGK